MEFHNAHAFQVELYPFGKGASEVRAKSRKLAAFDEHRRRPPLGMVVLAAVGTRFRLERRLLVAHRQPQLPHHSIQHMIV